MNEIEIIEINKKDVLRDLIQHIKDNGKKCINDYLALENAEIVKNGYTRPTYSELAVIKASMYNGMECLLRDLQKKLDKMD